MHVSALTSAVMCCDTVWSASVLKVRVVDLVIHVLSHLKEEMAWAANKQLWVISTIMLLKQL